MRGTTFFVLVLLVWSRGVAQEPPVVVPPPGSPPPQSGPPTIPPAVPPIIPPASPAAATSSEAGTMPAVSAASTVPAKPPQPPTDVAGRTIQSWVADFKLPDPTKRDDALKVIPLFGYEAARKHAMRAVVQLIDDPDPGVRINAILVISAIGFDNPDDMKLAASKLAGQLSKTAKGSMIRLHAVRAIASLGPDAHSTIGALTGIIDDPSWETRQAVAAALGRVGAAVYDDKPLPAGATMIGFPPLKREPSLTAMSKLNLVMIKDESSAVRLEACQSLVVLGPPLTNDTQKYVSLVQPFITAIQSRLRLEKDPSVRIWLQLVNIMYDENALEPTIKNMLSDLGTSDPHVRVQALNALGVLGNKAKPALGAMMGQLHDEDSYVAVAAINNILMMGSDGKEAIPEFERLIKETKNEQIRNYATEALKTLKKFPNPIPKQVPGLVNPLVP